MARAEFRRMVLERRRYARNGLDWEYMTRAARVYLRMMRGVPMNDWGM